MSDLLDFLCLASCICALWDSVLCQRLYIFFFTTYSFSQQISVCVFLSSELVWLAISVSNTPGSNRTPPSWRPRNFLKRGWRSIFWEESGRWGSRMIIMWHKMLVFSLFLVLLKVWLQWAEDLLAVCLLSYSSVTDVLVNKVITDSFALSSPENGARGTSYWSAV